MDTKENDSTLYKFNRLKHNFKQLTAIDVWICLIKEIARTQSSWTATNSGNWWKHKLISWWLLLLLFTVWSWFESLLDEERLLSSETKLRTCFKSGLKLHSHRGQIYLIRSVSESYKIMIKNNLLQVMKQRSLSETKT